jgi:hypothetical protein
MRLRFKSIAERHDVLPSSGSGPMLDVTGMVRTATRPAMKSKDGIGMSGSLHKERSDDA